MMTLHADSIRWLTLLVLVLVACSVDPKSNNRYHKPDCREPLYRGFCKEGRGDASVSAPDSGNATGDGSATGSGGDGGGGGGGSGSGGDGGTSGEDLTGKSCAGATMAAYCYAGPDKTDGVAICHGGHRDCLNGKWTECLGEVRPRAEDCNGIDDDCDGDKDNDIAPESCEGCGLYECTKGHKVCRKGQGVLAHEICNGKDDDCDGKADNDVAPVPCVDGNSGCTDSGGVIACKGICHSGTKTCAGGKLSATCEGQTFPMDTDDCNSGFGLNDDCDDSIDEDCTCTPNTTVPCYGGPADTLDNAGNPIGECRKGTQKCGSDGKYGACDGEQRPKDEDCTNIDHDDDCDGKIDEGPPGLGDSCNTAMTGECKTGTNKCVGGELQCVAPAMMDEICNGLDDNCDSYIDEPFDKSSDENNCGTCGKKCDSAQQCCAGGCTDTTLDSKNCGGCGLPCGTGYGCCNSGCIDMRISKANCGACGHACAANEQCCGGVCFNTATDEAHCGGCTNHACGSGQTCCSGMCKTLQVIGICI